MQKSATGGHLASFFFCPHDTQPEKKREEISAAQQGEHVLSVAVISLPASMTPSGRVSRLPDPSASFFT